MKTFPCTYELERWGEFLGRALHGLGYADASSLSWALDNWGREPGEYFSKVPKDVIARGFDDYLLVERVLAEMEPEYRRVAFIEYAAPVMVVGKAMTKRAAYAGLTISQYRGRLAKIHTMMLRVMGEQDEDV